MNELFALKYKNLCLRGIKELAEIWLQTGQFGTLGCFCYNLENNLAQSAGAVEYTDCISAEGQDRPHQVCPGYDTKQSDIEVPVMLELWGNAEHPFIASAPWSTQARNGSTWYGPIYGLNITKLHTYAKLNC